MSDMKLYSTTQAAKRLGITPKSLSRYISVRKVPTPKILESGKITHHVWTEEDVENLRKLLPKIANGRKTRYQKERQKAQPRAPQPRHAKTVSSAETSFTLCAGTSFTVFGLEYRVKEGCDSNAYSFNRAPVLA